MARRIETALGAVSALVPALLAALRISNVADVAHDRDVIRVLDLGTGPWRALDEAVGVVLSGFPFGTRAARAALGGTLVAAFSGLALYSLIRRLLAECASEPRPGSALQPRPGHALQPRPWSYVVASIATLTALLGASWQIESAAVGGSGTGGLLVLAALLAATCACESAEGAQVDDSRAWGVAAAALGLALGYDPWVGACAVLGCTARVFTSRAARACAVRTWQVNKASLALGLALGFSPLVLTTTRAFAVGGLRLTAAGDWPDVSTNPLRTSLAAFLRGEAGPVLLSLATAGTVVALLTPRARPMVAGLLCVAVSGVACGWLGCPLGPTRFGAPALAAVAATSALAAIAMQALVLRVAAARSPGARPSAGMVLLLELVLPVEASSTPRPIAGEPAAAALWDDAVWGELEPETVALVAQPDFFYRGCAARAQALLRGDIVVMPSSGPALFDPRLFGHDPALLPLLRDLTLSGSPTEATLSSLATVRPVVLSPDAQWGTAIGRHLLPTSLLDRFLPEPQSVNEKLRALGEFGPIRDRLAGFAVDDPELASVTVSLLRARALELAPLGDRDLGARAASDLARFDLVK